MYLFSNDLNDILLQSVFQQAPKHKILPANGDSNLAEIDMSYYLDNLNEYENLLAEGKIN